MIKVKNLIGGYMNCPIINGVNLEIQQGEFFALLGPNGSGKSTLFKLITGQLQAMEGEILLSGKDISTFSKLEKAKKMAVLTQESQISFDYTVEEIVSLGRYPHQKGILKQISKHDRAVIEEVMEITNISYYRNTPFRMISGGEKQRVLLAKALAQEPEILLLDEPTNHLDIKHTLQMLDLLKERQATMGLTIFAILHDLNIASLFVDRIALLHQGSILEIGDVDTLRKVNQLKKVYEVELNSQSHPTIPKPQILMTPKNTSFSQSVDFEQSYHIKHTSEYVHVEFTQPLRTISNGVMGDGIQWLKHFCQFYAEENVVGIEAESSLKKRFETHSIPHEQSFGIETNIKLENSVFVQDEFEGIQMLVVVTTNDGDGYIDENDIICNSSHLYSSLNLMLFIDAHLTDGALISALMTATEAKVRAVLELLGGSNSIEADDASELTDTILIGLTQQGEKSKKAGKGTIIGKGISQIIHFAVQEAMKKSSRMVMEKHEAVSGKVYC
ncbi:ATP-binding cassette domain-containing protein [Bacillus marasmi]|uniref:ABC transporter ATP-binding protein n=1 Tax=Bacillus marasmi TaxID=1926279 RepID=UPI0011CAC682|nr:ATP-binding cassette domain-containing protein [Bacillus marasmi]